MIKITVNNSFCHINKEAPSDVIESIRHLLSYTNDIYHQKMFFLSKLKNARSRRDEKNIQMWSNEIKKLEATENVCWFNNHKFPTGHLQLVLDLLEAFKQEYELKDNRQTPDKYLILRWKNQPFEPRYYQKEMIDLGVKNHRGVFNASVGSGKTLVMIYLLKSLKVNSIVVIPSSGLLEQVYNDMEEAFGSNMVCKIDAKKVRDLKKLKPIRLITIDSMASLQKTGDLSLLVSDVDALYLEEAHHMAASSYTNLLSEIDHIYYRFGFTGSFLRSGPDVLDMWGVLSNVLYSYPPTKAIEDKVLVPINAIIHEVKGKSAAKYQTIYRKNYCENPILLNKIHEIINTYQNDTILILVKQKEKSGKIISDYLNEFGINNIFISGDDDKSFRTNVIDEFNDKKIKVLIGSSVIGEGINVKAADHIIMAQGGKSKIVTIQAIGRVARTCEGKETGLIHDFNFVGAKYLKSHLDERISIYKHWFGANITYL